MKGAVENNRRFKKFGSSAAGTLETESGISKRVIGVLQTD